MKSFILFSLTLMTFQINAQPNFDKQGHRGARGLMPENTIEAMKKAMDLGVTTLELDVVITADKQVLVSHDTYFSHLFSLNPDGKEFDAAQEKAYNIYKMTFAETQRFDVGSKTQPRFPQQQKFKVAKPLLSTLIDAVLAYADEKGIQKPFFNIETKLSPDGDGLNHPAPGEFVELLIKVLNPKNIGNKIIIQSFDVRTLQYLQKNYGGKYQLALLIENKESFENNLKKLGFTPQIYSPAYQLVTPGLIKACHKKGIKIIPWTVNTKQEIATLKDIGVDGIITDYPNLF